VTDVVRRDHRRRHLARIFDGLLLVGSALLHPIARLREHDVQVVHALRIVVANALLYISVRMAAIKWL